MNGEPAKLTYTINEAASAIGVSRSKVYELLRERQLEAFKWCGRTLIRADVLQQAVDRASGRSAA